MHSMFVRNGNNGISLIESSPYKTVSGNNVDSSFSKQNLAVHRPKFQGHASNVCKILKFLQFLWSNHFNLTQRSKQLMQQGKGTNSIYPIDVLQ